ncbi:O-antigen ligase family protein [Colwellia echini]|uniref:O-antigen ligase domain-containing protein n=1 Tax=Colwellia echini TaxID=1982103 RepID=A0ABY3MX08_9GAMM|nr:O-antigen ligase family protein [Colwellia echini]TYK65763.1 O-antigen ligase domain-containing protein [Colwellia echini]
MSKFALLFLLLFASGLYAILFVAPVWGFYLYQVIYFLNPSSRWWSSGIPSISYSFVTFLLTLSVFLFTQKKHNLNTVCKIPEFKWFILLFFTYLMVTLVAVSQETHLRYVFDLFKLLLVVYVGYRLIDTEKKIELALLFYLLGCAYIGYEAFVVGRNEFGRVEGIGTVDAPEANGTATAIAPAISILLYYGWRGSLKIKILVAFGGALIVNGLILINSRGAFLGAAAGSIYFIFYMVFSKYKLPKQKIMLMLILLVGIAGVLRFTDDMFWERMGSIQKSSISDKESGASRVQYWLKTFDMLDDSPFGLGIYGYQIVSPMYLTEEQIDKAKKEGYSGRAVHSMWFQALSEIGWLGAGVILCLMLSIYKHLRRAKKQAVYYKDYIMYYRLITVESALISFMVAGSFINAFRAEIFYWLILFCICASTIALNKHPELSDGTS